MNKTFGRILFTSDDISQYQKDKLAIFKQAMNKECRKVTHVEWYLNGLYETYYTEQNKEYLTLINLSPKEIEHKKELLKPYETKVRLLNGKTY